MTMQDTRPEAPPTPSASDEHAAAPTDRARSGSPRTGWPDWLTTGDHRRIGRLYVAFALVFAVGLLVVGALLAFERVDDGSFDILHADAVAQLYSLYFLGFVFCVVAPLLLGLATAIVPLQVGARTHRLPPGRRPGLLGVAGRHRHHGRRLHRQRRPRRRQRDRRRPVPRVVRADRGGPPPRLPLRGHHGAHAAGAGHDARPGAAVRLVDGGRAPRCCSSACRCWSATSSTSTSTTATAAPAFGGNVGVAGYIGWAVMAPQLFAFVVPVLGFAADALQTFARQRLQKPESVLVAVGLAGVLGFGAWVQPAIYADVRRFVPRRRSWPSVPCCRRCWCSAPPPSP